MSKRRRNIGVYKAVYKFVLFIPPYSPKSGWCGCVRLKAL